MIRRHRGDDLYMGRLLNEKEFCRYLTREYAPNAFERCTPGSVRCPAKVKYVYLGCTRWYAIYRRVASLMAHTSTRPLKVLDTGFFPGSLVHILKDLFGAEVDCYGAGLKLDAEFLEAIASYCRDCERIDFDPFYRADKTPARLKYGDEFFDVVIAAEIIEHLISPLEMISEASRVLRKGGECIITTPNISRIGGIVKLLLGRSNYEALETSPMYQLDNEWRGHIRLYDAHELAGLFRRYGFVLKVHRYYNEAGAWYFKRTALQQMAEAVKMALYFLPVYREQHLAVWEKS